MGSEQTPAEASFDVEAEEAPPAGGAAPAVEGHDLVAAAAPIDAALATKHGVVESGAVRVDRWLWAARLYKTRSQAAKACSAGHVKMDGDSVKAAKTVRAGDVVVAQTPGGRRVLQVVRLTDRRGPAAVARALFHDYSPPPPPREEAHFGRRDRGAGRPEKRERRLLNRLRGR